MIKPGTTTVGKAIAKFIRALQERNASVHTIKAYRTDLEEFSAYVGPQGWGGIDHVLIRGYLSSLYERGLSKTSVARALAALRSLYRWLAQEEWSTRIRRSWWPRRSCLRSYLGCRRSRRSTPF